MTTPENVLDFLNKISNKEISVTPKYNQHKQYCGDLEYSCSNGYKLWVFNDCDEWDYLAEIRDEKGNLFFYFTFKNDEYCPENAEIFMGDEWEIIRDYRPRPHEDFLWGF